MTPTPEQETDGQMLQRLGADAAKWAAEFRKTAIKLGYSDMDEGWLIGWFANAIENAEITRRSLTAAAGAGDTPDELSNFADFMARCKAAVSNATIERCAQVVDIRMKYPQEDAVEWVRQIAQEIRALKDKP